VVYGDVEPQLEGPFNTLVERDIQALRIRAGNGDRDGIYTLDMTNIASEKPVVGSYSGGFMELASEVTNESIRLVRDWRIHE